VRAGVSDEEAGSISLDILLKMMRENYSIPLLLMTNRQPFAFVDGILDGRVMTMEKPIRRDTLYQNICKLFKILPRQPVHRKTGVHHAGFRGDSGYDGTRVLLAEDNEFNRSLLTAILEARGLAVTQVYDGRQALIAARETDYNIIIMDIHLPEMDGIETSRHIRELKPIYKTIPIIALTADIFFNDPQHLADTGIDACLLKPLDEEKLWTLINTLQPVADKIPLAKDKGVNSSKRLPAINLPAIPPITGTPGLANIFPTLLASLEDISGRLEGCLHEMDSETLARVIHELKGVVCYFGINDLSGSVKELEKYIVRKAEMADMAPLLRKVRQEISEFSAATAGRLHVST
jgi:two-component system sensor histidine kinase BarA